MMRGSKVLIVGRRLGRVTIVAESHEIRVTRRNFICVCDCGHRFERHYRSLIERAERGDDGCEQCSDLRVRRMKRSGVFVEATPGRASKKPCTRCYDLPHRRAAHGCQTCGEPPGEPPWFRPPAIVSSAGMWSWA
jgi:hypothetical protein